MITDLLKTVSYICPACFEIHHKKVNFFKAEAKEHTVACCDINESKVLLKKDRGLVLMVPCFACGSLHEFPVPLSRLGRDKLITFTCPNSGMEVMALGNGQDVAKWEKETEGLLDSLIEAQEMYNDVISELVNKIQMFCLEGKIICDCGECAPKLYVDDSIVTVKCKNCESSLELYIGTSEEVRRTLEAERFVLHNPNGKKKSKLHLVTEE